MTDVKNAGVSRAQFIRNTATGTVALVAGGSVLASATGVAFASAPKGLTSSDIGVLQTGYIAETLAVEIYSAIISTYQKKLNLDPGNTNYFEAALADEKAHQKAWKEALGSKTPKGFKLAVPAKYVANKETLLKTGVALEEAFVATYLGAVKEFSSVDLKVTAAGVAANEATHYSFFDAALPNGTAVLPAFGPTPITYATAAKTLESLGFLVKA